MNNMKCSFTIKYFNVRLNLNLFRIKSKTVIAVASKEAPIKILILKAPIITAKKVAEKNPT